MEALTPLAAFQALCLATAATLVIDARRDTGSLRYVFWAVALVLGAFGIFATSIGEAWPDSLAFMQGLGGSAVPWFSLAVALYVILRPRWKKQVSAPPENGVVPPAYDDTKLKAEVAVLAKRVGAVIDDYQRMSGLEARFSERMDKLQPELERLGRHADNIERAERRASAEELVRSLNPLPRPTAAAELLSRRITEHWRHIDTAKDRVKRLGVSPDVIEAKLKQNLDAVRNNALFCMIAADEVGIWHTPQQKQQWYVYNEAVDTLRRLATEAAR